MVWLIVSLAHIALSSILAIFFGELVPFPLCLAAIFALLYIGEQVSDLKE
jgi:hypothetical protein